MDAMNSSDKQALDSGHSWAKGVMNFIIVSKPVFFILIISLFSIRNLQSELKKIKIELENTKNNLFQTNEIIGMMQNKMYNTSHK